MYFAPEVSVLKRAEQMYIMDFLSSFLHEKNYGLTYLSSAYTDRYDQADAIVCLRHPGGLLPGGGRPELRPPCWLWTVCFLITGFSSRSIPITKRSPGLRLPIFTEPPTPC